MAAPAPLRRTCGCRSRSAAAYVLASRLTVGRRGRLGLKSEEARPRAVRAANHTCDRRQTGVAAAAISVTGLEDADLMALRAPLADQTCAGRQAGGAPPGAKGNCSLMCDVEQSAAACCG